MLPVSFSAFAEGWLKIDVGDYKHYSQSDLQKRVWELERAVSQLQERVAILERENLRPLPPQPQAAEKTWLCKITAMGTTYTGIGATKAIATQKAMDSCKARENPIFCNKVSCEE